MSKSEKTEAEEFLKENLNLLPGFRIFTVFSVKITCN
jgi:hypothetical protein